MSDTNNKFSPIAVELEKDKKYKWCTCSHSSVQPFCDGSHKAENATPPLVFIAEEDKKAHLCTCKLTKNPPFCDGTHKL
ncbi:CDGSH iron-sulfur domain-containing protein [Arenibacter sp. F26102]|uniref:CDGSH iron-sulfur domain-containing protein n=1 Tax=Arenibacter sp. F26102 TaxID=2926416 RepID=UPI001FF5C62E|nr:CDGSH iron-sulfur domain-containing protein [Arenibacter sp. F26102]MCK0145248.1 CDGSH iron-sulfur domain-containing protein [Arenibacter sp. F26102]